MLCHERISIEINRQLAQSNLGHEQADQSISRCLFYSSRIKDFRFSRLLIKRNEEVIIIIIHVNELFVRFTRISHPRSSYSISNIRASEGLFNARLSMKEKDQIRFIFLLKLEVD